MDCPDCDAAKTEIHAGYRLGCKSCAARMAAHSPAFARASIGQTLTTDYRALLDNVDVDTLKAHKMVKEWRVVLDRIELGLT